MNLKLNVELFFFFPDPVQVVLVVDWPEPEPVYLIRPCWCESLEFLWHPERMDRFVDIHYSIGFEELFAPVSDAPRYLRSTLFAGLMAWCLQLA
jgi:hypothetical protein